MQKFRNILVYVGGTNCVALDRAVSLAQHNNAKLTIMSVVHPPSRAFRVISREQDIEDLKHFVIHSREEELTALVDNHVPRAIDVEVLVRMGRPHVELIRQVQTAGHDLLMKTAEGSGLLKRTIYGSTARDLMRQCPCPVWIVKPEHHRPFTRVLAAVDVEPDSDCEIHAGLNRRIMELATSLAEREKAELYVTHVWSLWAESTLKNHISVSERLKLVTNQKEASRRAFNELLAPWGLSTRDPNVSMIKGVAEVMIPEIVDDSEIDLLVMGTICRTGLPGLVIGNTAERVLSAVDCSVLTLKPEGFVSTVSISDEATESVAHGVAS